MNKLSTTYIRFKVLFFASIVAVIALSLASCEKNLGVTPLPYTGTVSIQCLLSPNEVPQLYLDRTVPYFDPKQTNAQLFIRDAVVKITSGGQTDVLRPDSTYNGFRCGFEYFYRGKIAIKTNSIYQLDIQWQWQNYTATATTDLPVTPVENSSYIQAFNDLYGEHEGVVINFKDQNKPNLYYRYTMARMIDSTARDAGGTKSPCLTDKKVRILEIGRTTYASKGSSGLTIVAEPTFKHKNGDVGYIRLQTMDKNAYDFYDQLDRQKLSQFNPFVEPVFLKPTQFKNAFGVFGAIAVSDSVKFVYPE
ncbi:DUF4249 family protein [Runella sp. MFBS21]|uniref:DUF4249 family protein n=1 Tax=Runella sp. MFBS21 TaxID=3034018 RepID=UPI0023F6B327|nr:DUF4249 family protein [Runella sp. MFBS21]MCA0233126.1 DUF4249 domain-containing protein [Bacteroidota bacterium]MDF7821250.1 DUF4249 family protein [Runella sp. MFBS21]